MTSLFENVVPNQFATRLFTLKAISDLLGIPRTTISENLQKIGVEPVQVKVGAAKRKMFDWNAYAKIARYYRDQYVIPKIPEAKCKAGVNQKGGVGKTTTIQQLAMRYVTMGMKTLLIDNDPQGHSTLFFGLNNAAGSGLTLKNVYKKEIGIDELIVEICPLLHLVPSNTDLSGVELDLITDFNGKRRLKEIIDSIYDNYDIILIDNNPAFTWVTINAICAADELCFICETALYSLDGLKGLFEVLEKLEAADSDFGPILRVIPNKFKGGEKASNNALTVLKSAYKDLVTHTEIKDCADFGNATEDRTAVFLPPYRNSKASHDIMSLADELLLDPDLSPVRRDVVSSTASTSMQNQLEGSV